MAHTGAAMQHAVHTACHKGYSKSMHLVNTLTYLDQDMAVGLQFGHEAACDELSWHLTAMRGSGEIDKLAKAYLIVEDSPGCGAGKALKQSNKLEWVDLRGVYVVLLFVAGVCCIYKIAGRIRSSMDKGNSLHGFLDKNFPPSTCSVNDIVNEWLRAWELRRILRPLVFRHLQAVDGAMATKWAENAERITDIDNVTLTSSGEAVKRHRKEVLRRKMMLAFHSRQSAGATIKGLSPRLEIKLRLLAEVARYTLAMRRSDELNRAKRASDAAAPISLAGAVSAAAAAGKAGVAAGAAAAAGAVAATGAVATTVSGSVRAVTPQLVRNVSAKLSDGLQQATPQMLREASGKVVGAVQNAASATTGAMQGIALRADKPPRDYTGFADAFEHRNFTHDTAFAGVFIAQSEILRETIAEIRSTMLHSKMGHEPGVSLSVAQASFALKHKMAQGGVVE
jgi:hypothetical protein